MVKLRPLTDKTFLHSSLLKSILCPLNPEATSTHNRIENNQVLDRKTRIFPRVLRQRSKGYIGYETL